MNARTIKQWFGHATLALGTTAALAGFVFATHQVERRAEAAMQSAVTAPRMLYSTPVVQPVQMATVVITGKRS